MGHPWQQRCTLSLAPEPSSLNPNPGANPFPFMLAYRVA